MGGFFQQLAGVGSGHGGIGGSVAQNFAGPTLLKVFRGRRGLPPPYPR